MFALFVYLCTPAVLGYSGLYMPLFWILTALVIWGFVDVLGTPREKFEQAQQPLAMWVTLYAMLGPVAALAWLPVRKKVKDQQVAPRPQQQQQAYPFAQQPYVPPHLGPPTDGDDESRTPPLR